MKISIIGAGAMGKAIGECALNAGYDVVFVNSKGPHTLEDYVSKLGPRASADSNEAAIADSDIVILTVPWRKREAWPSDASVAGKIVVDAMNPYGENGQVIADLSKGSSEIVAEHLPSARLVKAFNTIWYRSLYKFSTHDGERVAMYISGDDMSAKSTVSEVIQAMAFAPVDLGTLRSGGRRQQPGTPLYGTDLTLSQAQYILANASESGLLPQSEPS